MMAESNSESSPSHMNLIFNTFNSVGYGDSNRNELFVSDKLIGGLSWCISSANPTIKLDTAEDIEDALKSIGCPHALKATGIEDLDYIAIYPVVQWLVSVVKTKQDNNNYMHERKASVLNELQFLKERINETKIDSVVHQLASLLKTSKALETQGCNFESECEKKRFKLLSEITELEERLLNESDKEDLCEHLDIFIDDSSVKLKSMKRELASKLRESVSLKRQLDDMPIAEEVEQYEQRFSELNLHIQGRLQRTRKYYATYNALLEIKDLMLKEMSLLNSFDSQKDTFDGGLKKKMISVDMLNWLDVQEYVPSHNIGDRLDSGIHVMYFMDSYKGTRRGYSCALSSFQDAIRYPAGRTKLIGSMESILEGIRQKLEKVQHGLQVERKTFDTLKEQYTIATADQRRRASLLKAFEEERRKNERLKAELEKNGSSASQC